MLVVELGKSTKDLHILREALVFKCSHFAHRPQVGWCVRINVAFERTNSHEQCVRKLLVMRVLEAESLCTAVAAAALNGLVELAETLPEPAFGVSHADVGDVLTPGKGCV